MFLFDLFRGIQGNVLWIKDLAKPFACKFKMRLLEKKNSFGIHGSPLLSAYPTLIWLCPLSPLLLNLIQTARCTTQGGPQLRTALCSQPHHASQSWVATCLCCRAISPWSSLHLNHGKTGVRKNKSSMLFSLSPRCPIKACYTAEKLHSRLGFQEIITERNGQHPVAVGEPLPVRVCGCRWYVCVCVLAQANVGQTWSMGERTHRSH